MDPTRDIYSQMLELQMCCQHARCRLCQFPIDEHERVVAAEERGREDVWCPEVFRFRMGRTLGRVDEEYSLRVTICLCCQASCEKRSAVVDLFHADCYAFKQGRIDKDFLRETDFHHPPPLYGRVMRERRSRFHRLAYQRLLRDPWVGRLPNEICRMIAGYLVREFALVSVQQQSSDNGSRQKTKNTIEDFRDDVYVTHILYEGKRYIHSISRTGGDGKTLIWKGGEGRVLRKVRQARDHLGIRHLELLSEDEQDAPSPWSAVAGMRWKTIDCASGIQALQFDSDGMKLREVSDRTPGHRARPDIVTHFFWPTRDPPRLDLVFPRLPEQSAGDLEFFLDAELVPVDCNKPGVTGYSALVSKIGVLALYTHYDTIALDFYDETYPSKEKKWWIYMPVDAGEHITEICKFNSRDHPRLYTMVVLGEEPKLTLLYASSGEPLRFWHNTSSSEKEGIAILGFESPVSNTPRAIPRSLRPLHYPLADEDRPSPAPWFYSSCSMLGVAQITLCIDALSDHKPVIGMLLRYVDGRRECVGEMRFDMVTEPIQVGLSEKLHICTSTLSHGQDSSDGDASTWKYVKAVTTQPPVVEVRGDTWLEVSWKGTLEWWFSGACSEGTGEKETFISYHSREDRTT
ncbi:hypothetical protein M426DRAFT_261938 [Hypoxylon sp. CI-4A]|nr:hypothetical protein M426DRAFT_261938 [Hypoxylon sp. CI-4A]